LKTISLLFVVTIFLKLAGIYGVVIDLKQGDK